MSASELCATFARLRDQWFAERVIVSPRYSPAWYHQPAYQSILRLGAPAVPLLIAEGCRQPDRWFAALGVLTRTQPVPTRARGKPGKMTRYWFLWGLRMGYVASINPRDIVEAAKCQRRNRKSESP